MATGLFDRQVSGRSRVVRRALNQGLWDRAHKQWDALRRMPGPLLWSRFCFRIKAPLIALLPMKATSRARAGQGPTLVPPDPWPGEAALGQAILEGNFTFAGLCLSDPDPLWQPAQADRDWLIELHSFCWLRDLRALGGDQARRRARDLALSWLRARCHRHAIARDPSVMSRRILHWLTLHDFFIATSEPAVRQKLLLSLASQCALLARLLPAGLNGSELIHALRALVTAGCCLPGGEDWLLTALDKLEPALAEQILGDGCHIERSPESQFSVLRDLVEIRSLLVAKGLEPPAMLSDAITAMAPMLRLFLHGDGDLAHFNGANAGRRLEVELVLQRCAGSNKALSVGSESGFQRFQSGRGLLLVDCGAPPPVGLDQLAHAGPLAFEFSQGRERIIVNCGARPWDPTWAAALKATAAHSCLTIDDTNAAELLPFGGLGRRPTSVTCRREEAEGACLLQMRHDGYDGPFSLIHDRSLYLAASGDDLRGEDRIQYSKATAPPRPFKLRFHLHPDMKVSLAASGDRILLGNRRAGDWTFRAEGARLTLEPSIYMGADGEARRSQQIALVGETQNQSTEVKWALRRQGSTRRAAKTGA